MFYGSLGYLHSDKTGEFSIVGDCATTYGTVVSGTPYVLPNKPLLDIIPCDGQSLIVTQEPQASPSSNYSTDIARFFPVSGDSCDADNQDVGDISLASLSPTSFTAGTEATLTATLTVGTSYASAGKGRVRFEVWEGDQLLAVTLSSETVLPTTSGNSIGVKVPWTPLHGMSEAILKATFIPSTGTGNTGSNDIAEVVISVTASANNRQECLGRIATHIVASAQEELGTTALVDTRVTKQWFNGSQLLKEPGWAQALDLALVQDEAVGAALVGRWSAGALNEAAPLAGLDPAPVTLRAALNAFDGENESCLADLHAADMAAAHLGAAAHSLYALGSATPTLEVITGGEGYPTQLEVRDSDGVQQFELTGTRQESPNAMAILLHDGLVASLWGFPLGGDPEPLTLKLNTPTDLDASANWLRIHTRSTSNARSEWNEWKNSAADLTENEGYISAPITRGSSVDQITLCADGEEDNCESLAPDQTSAEKGLAVFLTSPVSEWTGREYTYQSLAYSPNGDALTYGIVFNESTDTDPEMDAQTGRVYWAESEASGSEGYSVKLLATPQNNLTLQGSQSYILVVYCPEDVTCSCSYTERSQRPAWQMLLLPLLVGLQIRRRRCRR